MTTQRSMSSSRSPRGTRMGFDATRRYRDSKRNDIMLLVVAVVVIGVAVAWASGLF